MSTNVWEDRYRSGDTPWNKGAPSPGLVDFLRDLAPVLRGRVAVPGCGFGHDVAAWAQAQMTAVGYDLSETAVNLARAAVPAGIKVEFRQADFLNDAPPERYDWLFEHTLFCAIDRSMRDRYVTAVQRWLRPRGDYLAVNYFLPPEEDGPPWGCDREEIHRRFSPQFDLVAEWIPRSYPNRVGLERMFWWRKK